MTNTQTVLEPVYQIKQTDNNKFDVVKKYSDNCYVLINTFDNYQNAATYINLFSTHK